MPWHTPSLLPERPEVSKPQLLSSEHSTISLRVSTLPRAVYLSEHDVPSSPAPLSDVEQALDMTSQSSAVIQTIPFFVPPAAAPEAVPVGIPVTTNSAMMPQVDPNPYAPAPLPVGSHGTGATAEFVQRLGLPLFLVGQDVRALQTLASSPSLLSTLVDHNGMYDQARLLTLVQTLSATNPPLPAQQDLTQSYQHASQGAYGPALTTPSYAPPTSTFPPPSSVLNGFRSNNSDGNLHISGYGPSTTEQDIINLFAPYVIVVEVVMKGSFAFVNTNDPINAQRAREALTGSLLGGMPVRINPAQRKARDNPVPTPTYGMSSQIPGPPSTKTFAPSAGVNRVPMSGLPQPPPSRMVEARPGVPAGVTNVDAVRDDRGNPATKNLFVAGYGPGTTEQQIRDLFSQYCAVVGVVLKGNFTFVNTADRSDAVVARDALGGMMVNGGMLRINFAKETGRLGTSFDLTYGPNTGPNARNKTGPPHMSYYGR